MEKSNKQEIREEIKETGSIELQNKIKVFTIIGEIEGHEAVSGNTKATKYEHIIPQLAELEENSDIQGALFLLNTLGGDVEVQTVLGEGTTFTVRIPLKYVP